MARTAWAWLKWACLGVYAVCFVLVFAFAFLAASGPVADSLTIFAFLASIVGGLAVPAGLILWRRELDAARVPSAKWGLVFGAYVGAVLGFAVPILIEHVRDGSGLRAVFVDGIIGGIVLAPTAGFVGFLNRPFFLIAILVGIPAGRWAALRFDEMRTPEF